MNSVRRFSLAELEALDLLPLPELPEEDGDEDNGIANLADALAARGHEVVGTGSQAVILAMPGDPLHVLRISRHEDGWPAHALSSQGEVHAPRVAAFGLHDWHWFALVERLDPLPAEMDGVSRLLSSAAHDLLRDESRRRFAALERKWPSLGRFLRDRRHDHDDLEDRNLMMRGETLVVNDPMAVMGWAQSRRLAEEWTIALSEDDPEP